MRRRTTFRFGEHRVEGTDAADAPLLTAVAAGQAGLPGGTAQLVGRLDGCLRELHDVRRDLEEHVGHCRRNGVPVDELIIGQLVDATRHAKRRLAGQQQTLLSQPDLEPARLAAVEPVLRYGVATIAHVRGTLALYAAGQKSTSDILLAAAVARVERQVLDVFGLADSGYAVSMTSSGMAAYSLVESVVVRERLVAGDTVLLAPGIDRTVAAQVGSLPFVRALPVGSYDVTELADAARRFRARCVFADPVSGTANQRMIDVPALVRRLASATSARTTVVVDGTAMSGVLPPVLPAPDDHVDVLYYERGSELQLEVDVGVGGVVAYPARLRGQFERHSRNAGLAPHRTGVELFPRYDREYYRNRMRRRAANALLAATWLRSDHRVRAVGRVCHAGLADHPDARIAARLGNAGSWVNVICHRARGDKAALDRVVGAAAARARLAGVDITAAPHTGATPLLSTIDRSRPYLRLSLGDQEDRVDIVAEALAAALAEAP